MYRKFLFHNSLIKVIIFVFLVLFLSLFKLQIVDCNKYRRIAEENYVRIKKIKPIRGEIYDRKYRPIVLNKSSLNLYISLDKIVDKKKVIEFVSSNFNTEADELNELLSDNRYRLYKELLIVQNINFEKMINTSECLNYFPSLSFKTETVREYKYNNFFVGYVGRINETEYSSLKNKGYSINSYLGKIGLEKYYEDKLRGEDGYKIIQVDASGQNLQFFKHNLDEPPVDGADLILTIDNELQNYIDSIFPRNNNGAIVVMNIKNGDILAYVSKPNFDPNIFSNNISIALWNKILTDPSKPMLDRVIHGTYPPGSVYKPVLAHLGLEEKVLDERTKLAKCEGGMQFGNRYFKCWWAKGHGRLSVVDAIKVSCDVFFYDLSTRFSLDQVCDFTKKNMLTVKTNIDLPGERAGFYPTRKWYMQNYGKNVGIIGHKVNLAIGQGEILVTPLQICSYYAALGNDGKWIRPHLLKKTIRKSISRDFTIEEKKLPVSEINMKLIQTALYKAVNEQYGTGGAASFREIEVYVKTGSAENHMGKKTHSWFAGYAKCKKDEIAFVVFLENAGHGGSVSAPLAAKIIKFYNQL